jgi:hypothetical protein
VSDPSDELLRLLAREAMRSDDWYSAGFFKSLIDDDDDQVVSDADARFLAAVTPKVILRLLGDL